VSSLLRYFVADSIVEEGEKTFTVDTPFSLASWLENLLLFSYMALVLISIGTGKGLDNGRI
jgi:hypothetical protein